MAKKDKGVFCLQGDWFGTKDKTTVEPILHLLQTVHAVPYRLKDVATREEFEFRLKEWNTQAFKTHPILYLAFHGRRGEIQLGKGDSITLDELASILEGTCEGRIIHFGSCSTVDVHGKILKTFLRKTGALAVCGYKSDVDWLDSSIFDLLLFDAFQGIFSTTNGIERLEDKLHKTVPKLKKKLEFRIETL